MGEACGGEAGGAAGAPVLRLLSQVGALRCEHQNKEVRAAAEAALSATYTQVGSLGSSLFRLSTCLLCLVKLRWRRADGTGSCQNPL
jgi:hypothetical protein